MITPHQDAYEALRLPDFRYFLLTRLTAVLGIQVQAVVVGWQVYEKTKDPLALGLIGLAEVVPAVLTAFYGGYVSDRVNRKYVAWGAILALAGCSLALLLLSLPMTEAHLGNQVWPIYSVIFVSGIARGFLSPSLSALMPQLVPRVLYAQTSAWNGSTWQIAMVVGPAVGGLLYGFQGAVLAYSVDVSLMVLSLFWLSRVTSQPLPPPSLHESFWESMTSGVRFVFQNQVMLGAMTLDLFAVLFGGAVALLPIFAADILKVGPEGLGLLRAAPAVGAATMAFYLAYHPLRHHIGRWLHWAVAGFGGCMLLFALSTSFWFSVALLVMSGLLDSVSVVIRSTILQVLTPEEMRGRVSAANMIFVSSSNELGAFESGVAARLLGVIPSVIFGGIMTQVVVALTAWKMPKLRQLDTLH